MMPKMPRMFGANITSMLMMVSRTRAMPTWRSQLKDFLGNAMCWIALRTCEKKRDFSHSSLRSKEEITPRYHVHWEARATNRQQTYREQHNRDGQRHGCEDGNSNAQDQSVVRVNPAVRVQQFRLHIAWRNIREIYINMKIHGSINLITHSRPTDSGSPPQDGARALCGGIRSFLNAE